MSENAFSIAPVTPAALPRPNPFLKTEADVANQRPKWSPGQQEALHLIARWLDRQGRGARQVFRLSGGAGTGKTTLAQEVERLARRRVGFAAYTGKAALVLRSKGCAEATTLHSLIYVPVVDEHGKLTFVRGEHSPINAVGLLVVDEVSMVDRRLGQDLLDFGVPVLVIGDPYQLPPPTGAEGGFFDRFPVDVTLTEIHRQAAGNPIIALAENAKRGINLKPGSFDESRVVPVREVTWHTMISADQVLVGANRTRHRFNRRIRELLGRRDPLPVKGDKLVCLRNDKEKGLLNGGLWIVEAVLPSKSEHIVKLALVDEEERRRECVVAVRREHFLGNGSQLSETQKRAYDQFEYGYALTVHKAQGSQWEHVVVWNEASLFGDHANRWLYTAITRAREAVTVVIG